MIRRPPRSTRTDTPFPYATLFRSNLKRAICGGQLKMVYQPVLTIDGAPKFNSVEALLRWEHPEHGPISPEEFIPIAETSGQMPALGDWVIAKVLKDISRWPGLQKIGRAACRERVCLYV